MKKTAITLFGLVFLVVFPIKTWAETILDKIERTGEMTAGARKDAIPFGYEDEQGKWTGYSVDLIRIIHEELEKNFKKPIKLTIKEATIENRFDIVENGAVDLMCGATTITQERLKKVDFSLPFFMTGAQFLVKLNDAQKFDINGTLAKIPIAFIPGTTTQEIIPQIYPFADWTIVKSRREGIAKLKKGTVQAVVSDGVLLVGEIVEQGANPRDFILTPRQPITTELYGCMIPKSNRNWKEFIDNIIVGKKTIDLQDKWFNVERSKFPYIIQN